MGSLTPNSNACPKNVAMVYIFGVSKGSMPIFDLSNRGVETDIRVGSVECRIAVGAIQNGSVQLGSVWRVAITDLGGWVEGVRMSFVRAISRGARMIPATPAAETATAREESGDGEESISRPPAKVEDGDPVKESPGSGSESKADKKDRTKEVMVDRRIEWM